MSATEFEREQRNWAVILHLSVLLGNTLLPAIGWLVPFVLWQLKKDEYLYVDRVGRKVNNFLLNLLVLYLVGSVLSVIGVGFIILAVIWVMSVIIPIVAAVKESKGESFDYPVLFSFLV